MAEEKDDDKGGGGGGSDNDFWQTMEVVLVILVGVYILYRIVLGIYHWLQGSLMGGADTDNIFRRFFADPSINTLKRIGETSFVGWVIQMIFLYGKIFLFVLSAFFIGISVRFYRRIVTMTADEDAVMATPPPGYVEEDDPSLKRWKRIVEYVQSDNSSNWRLAILEADIILDEILDINGYRGDSIGDKLKQVERGDMPSLDAAWEAHKIRNAIAHEGEGLLLTEREARRVIGLYETVFKDFKLF